MINKVLLKFFIILIHHHQAINKTWQDSVHKFVPVAAHIILQFPSAMLHKVV